MKVKFYTLLFIPFFYSLAMGQECSSLSINYTATESRCMATGSVTVNALGGSGNFNYQAIGSVTTPVTSSNIITGLPGGHYTIRVTDITNGCTKELTNAFVPGTYQDPRFQLTKTDATCAGNDGTISAINIQHGRGPFTYTIIAPSASGVGRTSSDGFFPGLKAGEYSIQLKDSCGGIQVRSITLQNYSWSIDFFSVTRIGCDSADVFIRIKDNKGNVNTTGTALNGFSYGVVLNPGDTAWFSNYTFRTLVGTRRSLPLVVKDGCGTITSTTWTLPAGSRPSLNNVSLSAFNCTDFRASVSGQNLTNPKFCLYNSANTLVSCNTTGTFNNLPYGDYCIKVTDLCYDTLITRCFTAARPLPSVGSTVNATNQNCSTFTATVTGQQNLTNPAYCLYDASRNRLECNSTGVFTNVPYGAYCIEIKDGCTDTLITRCFTTTRPIAALTGYTLSGSTCSTFNVNTTGTNLINPQYCLFDASGNVVACNSTGIFTGIDHGNYCIRAISCSDTTNSICFGSARPIPSAGSVQTSNKQCSGFTATVAGQTNLTNPQYCLYNANDVLVDCNSSGVFTNLPYGAYCIRIVNSCYDTTITRCFTEARPLPGVSGSLQLLSSTCTTVSFKANGSNLTNPSYCLYDAADNLLYCNTTGVFNNYPYGSYCIVVKDGCADTTIRVCKTFAPARGFTLSTTKSCTIGNAYVDVQFTNNNVPYLVQVYNPGDSLVYTASTSTNPHRIQLPALPAGKQYKVVGTDFCGNADAAFIAPNANIVTKQVTARAKCPGSTWLNGSGDLLVACSSNHYAVTPKIIKKNGAAFVSNHSSLTSGTYTFADLEPAEYIIEYTQSTCNSKIYDTVTVPPYAYPTQGQSAIYQCDNNSFSLGADVQNGVSPYTFQIIGSLPASPEITTAPQNSPVFNINTGTTYSLVRLRTMDACGNATLSDVSVLPLQNISVTASDSCFYRNITLSVDSIPNASYSWYWKTSPTDSILMAASSTYNLPFFTPEQSGRYVCKTVINGGCITRLSYFTLDGQCGMEVLPVNFQLQGKRTANTNQLSWTNTNEAGILKYVVERKRSQDREYAAISTLPVQNSSAYIFNDNSPGSGVTLYRLKLVYDSKITYSNTVSIKWKTDMVHVYPNPVKETVNISLSADAPTNYRIELVNSAGQLLYSSYLKNIQSTSFSYTRASKLQPGIYLLRITNLDKNTSDIHKLVFE